MSDGFPLRRRERIKFWQIINELIAEYKWINLEYSFFFTKLRSSHKMAEAGTSTVCPLLRHVTRDFLLITFNGYVTDMGELVAH
jgi:hypothetical protein